MKNLIKEIEEKIGELKIETDKITTDFEKTIEGLAKKGYKIDKEKIQAFMNRFRI